MIEMGQSLFDNFTYMEIRYPEGRGAGLGAQQKYEAINNRVTYRLIDRDARRDASGPLSLLGMRQAGSLALGYNKDRYATNIRVDGEGLARYCFVVTTDGALEMSLGGLAPVVGDRERGLIYDGRQQRSFETLENTGRMLMWVDAARFERDLVASMDEPLRDTLAFTSEIDWSSATAAAVRRSIQYFVSELNEPLGLASVPAALESFTDSIVHLMLNALPHSYSERMKRTVASPIPAHLRRAIAFMHASADMPVTMADVAAAAGCGTRTLLNAFRRFRDTTPLAALHDIRLQHARKALLVDSGDKSISGIARQYGFSNPSRFVAAYGKRFGETPRETRAANRCD
jgi:AraC-like DNA-binding protein